ncbi:MAG: glucose-6-phosphate isomerase [Acidobacteria bacterium]|nr:glucose-6-phosphate isomerase [Acidobacteriota bacterium]
MKRHYEPAFTLADRLLLDAVVEKIWQRDPSAWAAAPGSPDAASITNRLGWLDVGRTMPEHMKQVHRLRDEVKDEGFEQAFLLGMGGSSLCGEVLRSVFGVADGYPQLVVLDTTDELTLTTAVARMTPARTLVIVASKSGGTVEVASMERFFWQEMTRAVGAGAGRHFIAITDPGTALHTLAESRGYREIFINPADIGGRFSALSLFGLVPAALIGAPVDALQSGGAAMAEGCRQHNHANAGLELGAFMAATALEGRDKLTLALAPSFASLGLWIEQLVAESTGKHGQGLLPVVDEPLGRPDEYGTDRVFVSIASESDAPDEERLAALEAAGFPVLRLSIRYDGLGAEFFEWEFATAIVGAALRINPFDEPNVSEAKEKTRALLAGYAKNGRFDDAPPAPSASAVRDAISSIRPGDYIAFLSYLPGESDVESTVGEIRIALRGRTKAASTFGLGPRYLHSTGQYHKGGPNTCVAFVLTGEDETETPIPEAGYSFSVLKRAQALGDVQALEAHGRRVVRLHFQDASGAAATLRQLFTEALA